MIVSRQNSALFSDKEPSGLITPPRVPTSATSTSPTWPSAAIRGVGFSSPSRSCSPARPMAVPPGPSSRSVRPPTRSESVAQAVARRDHPDGQQGHGLRLTGVGSPDMAGMCSTWPAHSTAARLSSGPAWSRGNPVGLLDPDQGDVTFDGVAGARTERLPERRYRQRGTIPATDATDEIVLTWADGPHGLNHEQASSSIRLIAARPGRRPVECRSEHATDRISRPSPSRPTGRTSI